MLGADTEAEGREQTPPRAAVQEPQGFPTAGAPRPTAGVLKSGKNTKQAHLMSTRKKKLGKEPEGPSFLRDWRVGKAQSLKQCVLWAEPEIPKHGPNLSLNKIDSV